MHADPLYALSAVIEVLERLAVPYFVGGSFASTLYGMIRTTQDADLVALLKEEHVGALVRALSERGFYVDAEMVKRAVREHGSFNLIHQESLFKVDIFVPRPRSFEESQFRRARRQKLADQPPLEGWVASPEDILLAKLEWYRLGGEVSERQWRDVLGILRVQGHRLDLAYLRRFAAVLGVKDLLARALSVAWGE